MKFLLPNYSCLQNPWLWGYRSQIPSSLSSVLNWICWPPPNKIPGYATDQYQQTTVIWSSTTHPAYNRTHTPRTFTDSATLWKNVLPLSSVQKNATVTICKGLKNFPASQTTECLLTVHPEQYVLFFKSGTQTSSETPALMWTQNIAL